MTMTRATMMTIATPPTAPTRVTLLLLLMMMMLPLVLPSVDVCVVDPVVDVVVPRAVLSPDFAETQCCFVVFLSKNKNLKQE